MNKWNLVYQCCGILFRHKKEGRTNVCHVIIRALKHYKCEKAETKGHMLLDSIYMKCETDVIHMG